MHVPRRAFLSVSTFAFAPGAATGLLRTSGKDPRCPASRQAREFLESSPIAFCRVADADGCLFEHARLALGNPAPIQVFHDGRRVTLRYPSFVLAYERVTGGAAEGIWFHAANATLALTRQTA